MRKKIWGMTFDTEEAKCLGTYRASLDMTDPRWMEESLYHSDAVGHFMIGRGGLQTPYSGTRGVTILLPMSEFLAGVWVRRVGGRL